MNFARSPATLLSFRIAAVQHVVTLPTTLIRHANPTLFLENKTTPFPPQRRSYAIRGKPVKEITPFTDPARPIDEAIRQQFVHVVRPDGGLNRKENLQEVLAALDRRSEHARQVGRDELGMPIVRIVTKAELFLEAREKKPKKQVDEKQLELNWAIDVKGDLAHRLKKLVTWLEEGKDVEVLLAPKKRGRRAEPEECRELLKRIRDAVAGVKGASEAKTPDGDVGKKLILTFQNRAAADSKDGQEDAPVKTQDMSREEKLARKEQEKLARIAGQEARAKRNVERIAQQRGTQQAELKE